MRGPQHLTGETVFDEGTLHLTGETVYLMSEPHHFTGKAVFDEGTPISRWEELVFDDEGTPTFDRGDCVFHEETLTFDPGDCVFDEGTPSFDWRDSIWWRNFNMGIIIIIIPIAERTQTVFTLPISLGKRCLVVRTAVFPELSPDHVASGGNGTVTAPTRAQHVTQIAESVLHIKLGAFAIHLGHWSVVNGPWLVFAPVADVVPDVPTVIQCCHCTSYGPIACTASPQWSCCLHPWSRQHRDTCLTSVGHPGQHRRSWTWFSSC